MGMIGDVMNVLQWIDAVLGDDGEGGDYDYDEAGAAGFDAAMGACGNSGQESIISDMEGAFVEAAEAEATGGSAEGVLRAAASEPEAVDQVLSEGAAAIAENLESQEDGALEDDPFDEEGEYYEEDYGEEWGDGDYEWTL